jgi:translocation and assembly module TamB
VLFQQLQNAWPRWRGADAPPRGQASDIGSLMIGTMAGTIQEQLKALEEAQARLLARDRREERASRAERLERLQSRIDADLTLKGPDLGRLRAELDALGHFWLHHEDRDEALASEPVVAHLEGPISGGGGTFSLSGLSLSLLALLTPVPESLRGSLGAQGTYRLGGRRPELSINLALLDTTLAGTPLRLERGAVSLEERGLRLDVALVAEGAESSVDLSGTVPLDPDDPGLELRVASRGDGLRFLTALAGKGLEWTQGRADLQLLVRGSLRAPIANGFLRFQQGEFTLIGQEVRELEATLLFDFEQLLVQDLSARVGQQGRISGEGKLGLVRPLTREPTLAVQLKAVPFSLPRITAVGDGELRFGGSLAGPSLGGELTISRGTINAEPGRLATTEDGEAPASDAAVKPVTVAELAEARWDFRDPLVLLGPEVESATGESLREAIPRFSYLSFDNLRVALGQDLSVKMGNVANFTTGGLLTIGGRLDPTLEVSGVVRLLQGQVRLFTTTFNLDPDAPNVAVFTRSLGLIPYLDIAMRTRVSDTLNVLGTNGPVETNERYLAELQDPGSFSALDQLNLVLISVSVAGPADRIAENLELRSSPPLPVDRLVALIGGNTLAGLTGGNAGAALATVVGQSLLSPLLSSLTSALGQRVSIALYPTYVNPRVESDEELRSEKVPPRLVLGTEVGVDVTRRIKASVLAAPNRNDVPPRFNLNYKASETFSLEGAIDTQGSWESQLRVFLRF